MQDLKYWIWLSRIENLTPIVKLRLIKKFREPKCIWNMSNKQLIQNGVKEDVARELNETKYRKDLEYFIEYMQKNNIETINFFSKDYPEKLRNIYDSPIVIYVKGNKKILNDYGFAIIGCRDSTDYGEIVAEKFSYNLGTNNINVISGLARGIDSYAHIGALKAKGKTIAVVGSGMDTVYPKENSYLFQKIIDMNGAIISEYVVGTKPTSKNFPARNRIISGISDGLIVVEAKEKSGTLITVDFALEQGKEVYVVPGNITSRNSYGTNDLIKQGAKIITSTKDIFI